MHKTYFFPQFRSVPFRPITIATTITALLLTLCIRIRYDTIHTKGTPLQYSPPTNAQTIFTIQAKKVFFVFVLLLDLLLYSFPLFLFIYYITLTIKGKKDSQSVSQPLSIKTYFSSLLSIVLWKRDHKLNLKRVGKRERELAGDTFGVSSLSPPLPSTLPLLCSFLLDIREYEAQRKRGDDDRIERGRTRRVCMG